jgi:predicted phosphodiesterase
VPTRSSPRKEQTLDYLAKFKGSPKQAIARVLFKDFPELFRSVEDARDSVRRVTGAKGKRDQHQATYVDIRRNCAGFPELPKGEVDIENFDPFVIEPGKTLHLSDVHLPFHDKDAVELAVSLGEKRNVDTVLLNGDIFDCYAQSRWQTDPRKRNAKKEIELGVTFFEWLRGHFPLARIVWKFGNHDERHGNYLLVRCPELLGLPALELENIVEASRFGIEVVKDMQPVSMGRLYALHGHEYKFQIANPVNPARGLYLRAKKSAICGHFHQESSHTESDISSDITTCWSVGCLCDLHPRYMPLNKWCHGAAIIEHSADGSFSVENKRIFRGAVL